MPFGTVGTREPAQNSAQAPFMPLSTPKIRTGLIPTVDRIVIPRTVTGAHAERDAGIARSNGQAAHRRLLTAADLSLFRIGLDRRASAVQLITKDLRKQRVALASPRITTTLDNEHHTIAEMRLRLRSPHARHRENSSELHIG